MKNHTKSFLSTILVTWHVIPTDERKDMSKKYEQIWLKVKILLDQKNNNSDDYDKKHMKIK